MKRQDSDDEEEDTQKKICAEAGAEAGEWFRLQAGKDKCRDVVSCTASVRYLYFLFIFSCEPPYLVIYQIQCTHFQGHYYYENLKF